MSFLDFLDFFNEQPAVPTNNNFHFNSHLNDELKTVDHVDLNNYLGTWYEISRLRNWFEDDNATDITAEYSLNDDGSIRVTNTEYVNVQKKQSIGKAYPIDSTNSKLKVTFDGVNYANYWIIKLTDKYSVVSDPSKKTAWILSRFPFMDEEDYKECIDHLSSVGIGLINVRHTM